MIIYYPVFIGCVSGKSDPYRLTESKNTVKVYEGELQSFLNSMEDFPRDKTNSELEYIRTNTRALELLRKMTSAYRDYVKELERYVPR